MNALTWLSLAALIALFYGPVQWLLESITRHHLFVMRDDLFDQALKGEVSFDSNDYVTARRQLNSLIRFTHLTNWQNMLLLTRFVRIKQPVAVVSPLYQPMRKRVALVMFSLIVLRSPVVLTFLLFGAMYQFVSLNFKGLRQKTMGLLSMIESESHSI